MIEISFALLIIAIGITSIFGLIPVGSKAQSDAMTYSLATDAAESVLSRIAAEITQSETNWDDMIYDGSDYGSIGTGPLYVEVPTVAESKPTEDSNWTHIDGSDDLTSKKTGIYTWDNATEGDVHRFTQFTKLDSEHREIDMLARVWQSPIDGLGYHSPDQNLMLNRSILLNVEMSWPIHLEFDKRKKLYYQLEVFCSTCGHL